jgi:hypothetical protein
MPVTARLSRRFYEKFGDEIVNELVEWLNQVDLTYRAELRDLNEANFSRFDAKLEQRLAELRGELRTEMHALAGGLRSEMHAFAGGLRSEMHEMSGDLRAEMHAMRGELRADMHAMKADMIKWMFLFWAGTALAGLLFR